MFSERFAVRRVLFVLCGALLEHTCARQQSLAHYYSNCDKESLSSVKLFIGDFIKDQIVSHSRWVTFEGKKWHSPKFDEKLSGYCENGVQMLAGFANWSLAYGV